MRLPGRCRLFYDERPMFRCHAVMVTALLSDASGQRAEAHWTTLN